MDKLIVGCGYLGRRVAARWLAQGHRVFGTTRSAGKVKELRKLGIEPIVCDVLDRESFKELPAVTTVLYCVGFDRSAGRSMQEVYVRGLENFTDCYGAPFEESMRLIYVSSTGVYGQEEGEEVAEESGTEPREQSGQVVLAAENVFSGWNRDHLGTVILRFAGIYGPGRVIRRQTIAAGEPLVGDPDKWLNLIHVEDGATAVLAAEERGTAGQIYNISDGWPVRRRHFYSALAKLLEAPEPRWVAVEPGAPLPPHERSNKRIVNRRMREELGVVLRYPTYVEGLAASI